MSGTESGQAPKEWRGRFYEDFSVGDVFRSRLGRTITETDNTWFTALTMNTNQLHFNRAFAERTEFGRPLVVSTLTLAVVLGLSVADTSENALANLEWTSVKMPHPVFAGDTLWAESEILSVRESESRKNAGIIGVRTRGINQNARVVIEFSRAFMVYKRDTPETRDLFPMTQERWSV